MTLALIPHIRTLVGSIAAATRNKPILLFGGIAAVVIGGTRYISQRREASEAKEEGQTRQRQGLAGSGLILVVVGIVMLFLSFR